MIKPLSMIKATEATLIYLFDFLMFGFIHKKDDDYVRGLVLGIWRFQLQISLGYSKEEDTGEIGHA